MRRGVRIGRGTVAARYSKRDAIDLADVSEVLLLVAAVRIVGIPDLFRGREPMRLLGTD